MNMNYVSKFWRFSFEKFLHFIEISPALPQTWSVFYLICLIEYYQAIFYVKWVIFKYLGVNGFEVIVKASYIYPIDCLSDFSNK